MKRCTLLALVLLLLASCSSRTLTVISFNVRNSSSWNGDGDNDWQHRREAVAAMILKEKPDALGMQEMLPDQLAYLDSALSEEYARIGVGRDDGKQGGESMCIYYRTDRLRLCRYDTYWLSATPHEVSLGWDAACRRTVTVGRFDDLRTGGQFCYLNTHLDHIGPAARRNSVLLLCELADSLGVPVVIGGDMNSDLSDTIFRPLEAHGLLSARAVAPTTDSSVTYTGFGKGKPSQIDHFFTKGFAVEQFQTLNGNYGVPYISDHYPVRVILRQ